MSIIPHMALMKARMKNGRINYLKRRCHSVQNLYIYGSLLSVDGASAMTGFAS